MARRWFLWYSLNGNWCIFYSHKSSLLFLRLADFPAWKTSNTVQEKPEPFKQPNIMPEFTLALTIVIIPSFFAARQRALHSTLTETLSKAVHRPKMGLIRILKAFTKCCLGDIPTYMPRISFIKHDGRVFPEKMVKKTQKTPQK